MGTRNEATRGTYALKKQSNDPSYRRVHGNFAAKKYNKGTPANIRLSFEFTGDATQFIDIAKALSIINRKMVRQGHYFYVNSVELYNNEDTFVDIHTIPDNWVTRSAYRRGKATFEQMNELAMTKVNGITPKYHDFKVYMSDRHRTTGSADPSLYNINSASAVLSADDWVYSQLVSADSDGDISNPGTGSAASGQRAPASG